MLNSTQKQMIKIAMKANFNFAAGANFMRLQLNDAGDNVNAEDIFFFVADTEDREEDADYYERAEEEYERTFFDNNNETKKVSNRQRLQRDIEEAELKLDDMKDNPKMMSEDYTFQVAYSEEEKIQQRRQIKIAEAKLEEDYFYHCINA